jgi:hypothetical protein
MRPPYSAGGQSLEGSDAGSDEFTTALPVFDKEKEKERKERGLQKILPFRSLRRREDKEKDKDKDKDKGKDRERSSDRGGSALGNYSRGNLSSTNDSGDF